MRGLAVMEDFRSSYGTVRFAAFELDSRASELRKHGAKIKLQDQPFQILQILLQRPGEIVTREELQQKIGLPIPSWTSTTALIMPSSGSAKRWGTRPRRRALSRPSRDAAIALWERSSVMNRGCGRWPPCL